MKIIVCVKQVPDTTEIKIDPVKGTLIREGVPSILNPDDANAVEAALQLREQFPNSSVIVLTMGPPQAREILRECFAMGADRGILLSDRAFAGSDTWATSNALAAAIRKLGPADIVLTGRQAIDGDTAQVGPQTAQRLGLPQVSYVMKLNAQEDGTLLVRRKLEDGYEELRVAPPVLLTAVKELNEPRYMSIGSIMEAFEKPIEEWSFADLGIDAGEVGLSASPTRVHRSFTPEPKGAGKRLEGLPKQQVAQLFEELRERKLTLGGKL